MPTREQLIENIKAMETQGAQPAEIQSYLDSFKGKQPSGVISPQPMDISLGEKVGSFLAPTATESIKKFSRGEKITGREALGSALEIGSYLVPVGAVARGAGLAAKGIGLAARGFGARALQAGAVGAVSGGMAGAGREVGAGGTLGEIASATAGGAALGGIAGAALPVIGAGISKTVGGIKKLITTPEKITGPIAEKTMQRVARISKQKQINFEKTAGESVGKYLVNRGFYGNVDDISQQLANHFQTSKNAADDAIASLPGKFQATQIKNALSQLFKRETKVSTPGALSKDFKRVRELVNNYNRGGLDMSEINEVKRLYERNVKLEFKKSLSSAPETIAKSTNIDNALREWQFKQAEKLGLKNLPELNRETRLARQLLDDIGKEYAGIAGNNAVSLTDWVVLSGGDPTAVLAFLTKKGLSSKSVQSYIAKTLAPKATIGTPTAQLGAPKPGFGELIEKFPTGGRTTPQ